MNKNLNYSDFQVLNQPFDKSAFLRSKTVRMGFLDPRNPILAVHVKKGPDCEDGVPGVLGCEDGVPGVQDCEDGLPVVQD